MKNSSMRLCCLFLAFTLFFQAAGCTKQDSVLNGPSHSYLALGDSYTIGESVSSGDRFPAQAVALLKAKGILVTDPEYIARTGWTTADLQTAINKASLKQSYDMVSLLIGVNDQYQGLDTAGYRVRFAQLLKNAIQLAGNNASRVFVLSIPDYSVTPFGGGAKKIQVEIEAFNQINKQVTDEHGVNYIDITGFSRKAAADQTFTAYDGLHPSAKQYALWAASFTDSIAYIIK